MLCVVAGGKQDGWHLCKFIPLPVQRYNTRVLGLPRLDELQGLRRHITEDQIQLVLAAVYRLRAHLLHLVTELAVEHEQRHPGS